MILVNYRFFLLFALWMACAVIAIHSVSDLSQFHYGARMALEDPSKIYAYPPDGFMRFFFGPISAVLLAPLGYLSISDAKWVWIALQTASFVLFWVALFRLYPQVLNRLWPFLVVFIFSINPLHTSFQSNNISLMLGAALLLSECYRRSESRSQHFIAGIVVTLCGTIKVFPLFVALFYWLIGKRALRFGILVGAILSVVVPLLFFGWNMTFQLFGEFFSNISTYRSENSLYTADILCLPSLITRWFEPYLGEPLTKRIIQVAFFGVSALFFASVLVEKVRRPHFSAQWPLYWALALGLMTLLNFSSRVHYMVFYLPLLCGLLQSLLEKYALWKPLVVLVSLVFIALTPEGVVGEKTNNLLELWNIPTVGLLALSLSGAFLIWSAGRSRSLGSVTPGV